MNKILLTVFCAEKDTGSSAGVTAALLSSQLNHTLTKARTKREVLEALEDGRYDLYLIDYRLAEKNWPILCHRINQTGYERPFIFFSAEAGESRQLKAVMLSAKYCRQLAPERLDNFDDVLWLLEERRKFAAEKEALMPAIFFTFI